MVQGFDCATKLTGSTATALRAAGFEYVARYLGNSWKTFNVEEAEVIKGSGLKLISIFEKNSTKASYFSKSQGMADAQEAFKYAKSVGQPTGSTIYFTVDYDAQPADIPAILDYLNGVKQCLVDYKIGLYGSYNVMQAVRGHVDYYWQTYAWSHGNVADFIHIYQNKNGVSISGIQLDKDGIRQAPGAWGESVEVLSGPQSYATVTANFPKDYGVNVFDAPNGTFKNRIKGSTPYRVYAEKEGFYDLGNSTWLKAENVNLKRDVVLVNFPKGYGVNVYDGPNGNFKKRVKGQDTFIVYAFVDGWYDIGQSTWIKSDCVKVI
jgi:hypothetical protein